MPSRLKDWILLLGIDGLKEKSFIASNSEVNSSNSTSLRFLHGGNGVDAKWLASILSLSKYAY